MTTPHHTKWTKLPREARAATVPLMQPIQSPQMLPLIRPNGTYRVSLRRPGLLKALKIYVVRDVFHSLVDMDFMPLVGVVVAVYLTVFAGFACIYIALPPGTIENVVDWTDALWFSVQTMYSIGYGYFSPHHSALGNGIVMIQVIAGILTDSLTFGVFFAKFSRPTSRRHGILFSNDVCIFGSDGSLAISLRVMNLRRLALVDPVLRLFLISAGDSGPGSIRVQQLPDLEYSLPPCFMNLPLIVSHSAQNKSESPLFGHSRTSLEDIEDGEIIAIISGIDAATADQFEARKSYKLRENVKWNHRFCGAMSVENGSRVVDVDAFHETRQIEPIN